MFITLFHLCSMDVETLHIYGSLHPAHTGSIRFLDKDMEDDALTDRFLLTLEFQNLKEFVFRIIKPFH